jgi:hypothetical protein
MNSNKLAKFNEDLIKKIVIDEQWHKILGVSQEVLKKSIIFSERYLFAETENHPEIKRNYFNTYVIFIAAIWLIVYISYAYFFNLLINAYIFLNSKSFCVNEKNVNFFTISPGGKTNSRYLEYTKKNNGLSINIIGVKSWREIFENHDNIRYETLLSLNLLLWIKVMFIMVSKIRYIYNNIYFDSLNKEKNVAQFFYVLHKQIIMSKRSKTIAANLPKSHSLVLMSSESISFSFVESLKKNNHIVCHHIHGIILENNLICEPPLSNCIITSGIRESKIFKKYKNILSIPSVPPFQMHNEIIYSRKLDTTNTKFDVLLIASFELPFIQKSTYNILKDYFINKSNLNMLLRHHPRVPSYSRKLINSFTKGMTRSFNSSLADDVALSNVIVCCSIDSLIIPLIMKKATIFLPMTDGDYGEHIKDFDNYLPNLWCPKSKFDLSKNINSALQFNSKLEDNYFDKISYLLGNLNLDYFDVTLKSLINSKNWIPNDH